MFWNEFFKNLKQIKINSMFIFFHKIAIFLDSPTKNLTFYSF